MVRGCPLFFKNNHVNAFNKIKGMPVKALLVRAEKTQKQRAEVDATKT